jgi:hypothetical protein
MSTEREREARFGRRAIVGIWVMYALAFVCMMPIQPHPEHWPIGLVGCVLAAAGFHWALWSMYIRKSK